MGKVYVGEFGFDNLKEAQDYAKKVKEDPSYVPPVKADVNDGFVPHFDPQEPGPLDSDIDQSQLDPAAEDLEQGLAMEMDEAAPGQDKTVESNTVVVETGLEFETKEIVTEDDVPSDVELVNDHELPSDVEQDILDEAANAESDN